MLQGLTKTQAYLKGMARLLTGPGARKTGAGCAIKVVRANGLKVGMVRPITLWPFPSEKIKELAARAKHFLVFEMNMGQMVEDVQLALDGSSDVSFYGRPGGVIPTPSELSRVITRHYYQKGLKVSR